MNQQPSRIAHFSALVKAVHAQLGQIFPPYVPVIGVYNPELLGDGIISVGKQRDPLEVIQHVEALLTFSDKTDLNLKEIKETIKAVTTIHCFHDDRPERVAIDYGSSDQEKKIEPFDLLEYLIKGLTLAAIQIADREEIGHGEMQGKIGDLIMKTWEEHSSPKPEQ